MPTEEQLQADLQLAMKARETDKVLVLRGVITAIKNLKVERMVQALSEPDIAQLIRKEVNKRVEAAEFARKANRIDLAEQSDRERAILEQYLPRPLTEQELETVIRELAKELGGFAIGPIMQKLRERYAGRYDGKLASEIVRKLSHAG